MVTTLRSQVDPTSQGHAFAFWWTDFVPSSANPCVLWSARKLMEVGGCGLVGFFTAFFKHVFVRFMAVLKGVFEYSVFLLFQLLSTNSKLLTVIVIETVPALKAAMFSETNALLLSCQSNLCWTKIWWIWSFKNKLPKRRHQNIATHEDWDRLRWPCILAAFTSRVLLVGCWLGSVSSQTWRCSASSMHIGRSSPFRVSHSWQPLRTGMFGCGNSWTCGFWMFVNVYECF